MPFKPGESGNPGGKTKDKLFRNALIASLKKASEDGAEAMQQVADALVAKAKGGDVQAIKEVADRVDGKVPQAVTGEDGEPLTIQIIRFGADSSASS